MEIKVIYKKVKYSVFFDLEDLELILKYRWYIDYKGYIYGYPIDQYYKERKYIKMHRLVMRNYITDKDQLDHKNHNKKDNRKFNLRKCTNTQNQRNRISHKTSTYKGVAKHKYGFEARISVNKERINCGFFKDPVLAAKAYDDAAKKYFGEFANLNFK